MEQITNSNEQHDPFLPAYLRKRLATAKTEEPQPSETQTEETVEQTTESQPPNVELPKTENNNEWKGRLRKEQEQHKQTSERLLAEVAARQKAEQELADLKAKQTTPTETAPLPTATADDWTDDELEDISVAIGGKAGEKFVRYLKGHPQSMPDVNKVVEEKFEQQQAQSAAQLKAQQWQKAISEQIPEIHGLLQDAQFTDWAYGREVDYLGNTAMQLITNAGQTQNVALVPKIRALLDEFNQSKQPPQPTTTAPPNKGAVTKTAGAKPKMTAKDIAYKQALIRQGKTQELIAFLQKFDHT